MQKMKTRLARRKKPLLADAEPKTLLALWIAIATAACGLVEGGGKEVGGAGTGCATLLAMSVPEQAQPLWH